VSSPLPTGLYRCGKCRSIRGVTPDGWQSVCYCDGRRCARCKTRWRLPISDYYDPRDGEWWHVPWLCGYAIHKSEQCPKFPPPVELPPPPPARSLAGLRLALKQRFGRRSRAR